MSETTSKLRAILSLVQESGGAISLDELALRMQLTPSLTRQMVEFWEQRGKLNTLYGDMVHCTAPCRLCGVTSCPAQRPAGRRNAGLDAS